MPNLSRRARGAAVRGRVVAITGGARGIGLAAATLFANSGATVVIGDLDGDLAAKQAASLGGTGLALDVRSRDSFRAFLDAVAREHGRLDVLVNNAGIMPLGRFADESDATTDAILDINVRGVLTGVKLAIPLMLAGGGGHIVNVASMIGKVPAAGAATYTASKFAIVGFTQAINDELAGSGITVGAVLPAAVRTDLIAGMREGGLMPTVDPEDVAAAVLRSCAGGSPVLAVPAWSAAGYDLAAAVVPPRAMSALRRRLTRERVFSTDAAGRADYTRRIDDLLTTTERSAQ
jgi:NAD(P)-dependent dehydrogenase (short-subunit alcohol dehydrogenase family)